MNMSQPLDQPPTVDAAHLPPPPVVQSMQPAIPVAAFATGWQTGLLRPQRVKLLSLAVDSPVPGVASMAMGGLKLRTSSFRFPELPGWQKPAPAAPAANSPPGEQRPLAGAAPAGSPPPALTRLRPPQDVIKLEDRLYYLLQPALETTLRDGALAFPFHPFPYQLEGVAFLYPRVAAVLADEMGLGKTMQAITAVRMLLHAGEVRSVLLICPKPLVSNWRREFAQWAPEIPLAIIEGDHARRRWQWRLPDAPLKLANYELVNRDRAIVAEAGLEFDLVILDEAQRIKNRSGSTSQAVRAIRRRRSWALTGTPVENSTEDLVGIFEFLMPGHLSSEMKPRRLGEAASPYVLRRTKDKVLTELPPKMFRDAELELSPEQRESYQLAEDEGVLRLNSMSDVTIQHVFELVLRLKQICNFDPATGISSKCEQLEADLEEVVASGRKAIVFSQWVHTLDTLGERLQRFRPLAFHGQIPSHKRDGVIAQFRDEPGRSVLLISYGAGGVGLNLQFAGYVFLFDRWWNPAIEDQAINRAHRIGAAGPVTVTRFLALDTIEQRIDQVLREKREIFDMIFSEAPGPASLGLTQQEIFGLFKLRCPSGPIEMRNAGRETGAA